MTSKKSREDWDLVCSGYRDSGLSQEAYCRQVGIKVWCLKYHLNRQACAMSVDVGKGFSRVKIGNEQIGNKKPYCSMDFEGLGKVVIETEIGLLRLKQLFLSIG